MGGAENERQAPHELLPSDVVARVLYSKSRFSRERQRPKPNAFDPTPYTELSVIHVTGLSDLTIWQIAKENTMRDEQGRDTIHGRADVPVEQFLQHRLRAIRDNQGFDRHTSVVGWPTPDDANERKERWKEICLALSQSEQVKLVLPVEPIRFQKPLDD